MHTIELDPGRFTESQWEEMFNAADVLPLENRPVKAVRLSPARIRYLAEACRARAKVIKNGPLRDKRWIADLTTAADTLDECLAVEQKRRRK